MPILHNAASNASDILARCYRRSIAQCECCFTMLLIRKSGLMLVVLHSAVCYSSYVSEKMILCYSNIATNIAESLPGIWCKGAETMASL